MDPSIKTTDRDRVRRLWRDYIWPQRRRLFVAIIFMTILALSTAAYTSVVAFIVDKAGELDQAGGALDNAKLYAYAVLPLLLGITLISGISNYTQHILSNKIALNAVAKMQKQMFESTHNADYAAFSREPTGNLIAKFTSDIDVVTRALIRSLANLIRDVLTLIFTIGFILYHNWQLSLLVCVIYPIAAWPIIQITKRLRGNASDVQSHIGRITSELKESFGGARMIKTYGLETKESERLGVSFDERIRLFLKLVTEKARVDPILEVMGGLAIAGVVIFGVWQVSNAAATAGSIAAVLTGLLLLSPKIRAIGTLSTVIQEGLASLTRIFHVIDENPNIKDASGAIALENIQGAIAFENVHFTYADDTQALNGISLNVSPGKTIALVGESGGGKSTIINLIPRLYDVTQGAIKIDDQDIRNVTLESLRRQIALVSQDVTLFNDSVAANIGYGDLSASRDDIIKAARAADADGFISELPEGYDTMLGEDGDSLSGGQKQRLTIARAILRDAPILLLDEATSALDADSEAKVQNALERLSKGRTTIVIAHRLSTIQKADRIYVLEDGNIVETGTHKSLKKKRGGVYARLQTLQSG